MQSSIHMQDMAIAWSSHGHVFCLSGWCAERASRDCTTSCFLAATISGRSLYLCTLNAMVWYAWCVWTTYTDWCFRFTVLMWLGWKARVYGMCCTGGVAVPCTPEDSEAPKRALMSVNQIKNFTSTYTRENFCSIKQEQEPEPGLCCAFRLGLDAIIFLYQVQEQGLTESVFRKKVKIVNQRER